MIVVLSLLSWIGGIATFSFMSLVLLIFAPLSTPRGYDGVLKLLCRVLVRCFPVRVEVVGLHRLDRRKSYLFVSNHVNLLDGFLLYGYLPWLFRAIELDSHFAWPVYGWFIRTFGNIPVSPGSGARTAAGMRRADKTLRAGISILVLPEGHRTRTGALGAFGRGAFQVAEHTGAEIVPVVMAGSFYVMRIGRWTVRPGTVRILIGDPIRPTGAARQGVLALRDLVHAKMNEMLCDAGDRADRALSRRALTGAG